MTVRTQVHERIAPLVDSTSASMARETDSLMAAGLVPMGRRGGRSGAAHFFAPHLKAVLLGTAAIIPSEAAKACMVLDGLVSGNWAYIAQSESARRPASMPPKMTLGDYVISRLYHVAVEPLSDWVKELDKSASGWRLVMSPDIREAAVYEKFADGGLAFTQFFSSEPAQVLEQTCARSFEIRLPVLQAAGELLLDSLQHQFLKSSDPPTGGERSGDAPKRKKAASVTSRRDLPKLQPANELASRPPCKVQAMPGGREAQARSLSPLGSVFAPLVDRPPSFNRSDHHGESEGGPLGPSDCGAHGRGAARHAGALASCAGR